MMQMVCFLMLLDAVFTQESEYSLGGKSGTDHFRIESVSMCEEVPGQIVKFYLTPKTFNLGAQIVDINMTSPKPIGENTQMKCVGYTEVHKHWMRLFSYEEDFCTVLKTFVGQLFYDLERAAGVIPGSCPIPRGNYHIVNFTLNFEKFKLQYFPIGKMKYKVQGVDKTTKNINGCVDIIITNQK